ncbi:ankyrin repeat domain-containing protein 35-like [Acipenser ruthenus]|uniref:ankyrin repeat domain-containing protein 35-like n=1 Tax=Acipenser ruthenus TaxID=7906 RepID=UPI002741B1FB|nr:ankyrin repeat domain-containing protein 35-like [Acipenser ruthenus]
MKKLFSCSSSPVAVERWGRDDQKLLSAVDRRDVGMVSAVLSRRTIRPTKLDEQGRSSFHLAASKGIAECLDMMLAHGTDSQARDTEGCSALHLAAKHGQPECVKTLLQHNIPADLTDCQGWTALHYAALAGCAASVALLCGQGAPIDSTNRAGQTALMIAARERQGVVCAELARRGADVNTTDHQGKSALMVASQRGCVEAVRALLAFGADVRIVDSLGEDAVHYATQSGSEEVVTMLKNAQKNTGSEMLHSDGNESGQPFEAAVSPEPAHWESERRERYETEQREIERLHGELNLKIQESESLKRETEALRGRLKKQTKALRLLFDTEGETEGVEGEGGDGPLLDRLASLLREKRAREDGWRLDQRNGKMEAEGKMKKERASVEVDALRLDGALEAKESAERRVSEIEGHLDNMRAILSQYETRKRVQSCVIEDLETQVSELAAENETLRSRLQELQQNLQAERLKTQDSVSWQDFSEGRQALGGSIAELRHLLCDVRLGYTDAWRMREARLREMKDRQAELDMLRARLETHFVPMEDHRRCKASWEGSVKELEKMVLKLKAENQELRSEDNLREEGGRRQCVGLQRHPGNPGTLKSRPVSCRELDEPKTVGTTRAWQSEGLLLSEKQNGTHSSLTKSEDHLQQLCKVDKATCTNTQYSPLNIKEKDFLQGVSVFPRLSGYFKGDDFLNKDELEDAVTRKRMGKVFHQLSPGGLDFPGDGKKADWRTWNCGEAAVEKSGRQEFLTQGVFGKTNLERDEEKGMPDSSSLLKDRSEREADFSKIQGLMVDITHLEEDLALEQQVSRKLQAKLTAQENEIRGLRDSFPPNILREGNGGSGKGFDCDAIEELCWNIGSLVKMYHEARLQLQAITSAEKQQGLANKQASEISGLKTELSKAKQKAVDLKKKLDDQIKESVNKQEHFRVVTALETEVKGLRSEVEKMETHLGERKAEASRLQAEVDRAFQEMRSLELQEKHRQEEVKGSLEKDQALGQDLRLVSSKCEDLRQETAHWKQQVVEERERRREMSGRVLALERMVCEKEREAQKLAQTVLMLKTRGEELTQACENKDRKIVELQTEEERLSAQRACLHNEIGSLREQLKTARKRHQDIVSVYRTHLLSAAQGVMDEEVHLMLLKINNIQREAVS